MSTADDRRFEVLRAIVADFVTTKEPIGSKTLVERHNLGVSSATVRNDMAVLEAEGYITQPHTSSGRVPTEKGLRLFVDGLLEIGELAPNERAAIEARLLDQNRGIEDVLTQATLMLSGLSRCAGLVVAAKQDMTLKHVEFVSVACTGATTTVALAVPA